MKKARKTKRTLDHETLARIGGGAGYDWTGNWQSDNPYGIPGPQDMANPGTGSGGGSGGGWTGCKDPFADIKYPMQCSVPIYN